MVAVQPHKPGPLEVAAADRTAVVIHAPSHRLRNGLIWIAVAVAAILIGLQFTGGFPHRWVVNIANWFDSLETWAIVNQKTGPLFVYFLNPLTSWATTLVNGVIALFDRMTFLGVIVAAAAIAGVAAGWRMAVLAAIGFVGLGVFGLWPESMETLALMLVSVSVALAIGIPLGVLAGRRPGVDRALRPILDAMQTVPAFAYLAFLVVFLGIGPPTAVVATVIFALPPAIRLTSLGLRGVPLTSLEVADSFGATRRQRLGKVQLPMARPSIMLGVNQTIMMAMGIVVIASLVGYPGLGATVLDALETLDVGKALDAGITIVIMAVVLDRVSYAWSSRGPRRTSNVSVGRFTVRRWQVLAFAVAITAVAVFVGRDVLVQQDFPTGLTFSVAGPTNSLVDWLTFHLSGVTGWISDILTKNMLDPLFKLFMNVPWWMVAGAFAVLAWNTSKRVGLAVTCVACMGVIGVLGMWDQAMNTLSQVVVAVILSVAIAVPLGVWASQSDRVAGVLRPILDTMQTMPAFVYLVPVVALFNVGRVPGVIASVVYALPPGVRLTNLGIRGVSKDTVEAARSFGSSRSQLLRKVQLPLARPSILLGVNQTVMMVLSVVIIAALIGASGLGFQVLYGLHHSVGLAAIAGLAILMLAIVIDRITQSMGAPGTARGPVGIGGLGWWTRHRALQMEEADLAASDVSGDDTGSSDDPGKGEA